MSFSLVIVLLITHMEEMKRYPLKLYARMSSLIGVLLTIAGILIGIGWWSDIAMLKTLGIGNIPVNLSATFSVFLCGLTLILIQSKLKTRNIATRIISSLVFLIALVSLVEFVFSIQRGLFEMVLSSHFLGGTESPASLSLNGSIAMILISVVLFCQTYERFKAHILVIICFVLSFSLGFTGILNFGFGLTEYSASAGYANMSIPAIIYFMLLCVGILFGYLSTSHHQIPSLNQVLAGLLFAGTVIIFVALLSNLGLKNLRETGESVEHTQNVRDRLNRLLSDVIDIQTGVRGYLLINEPEYIEPMTRAKKDLAILTIELASLIRDNPDQLLRLDTLNALIEARVAHAELIKSNIEAGKTQTALTDFHSQIGKDLTDQIRILIDRMKGEENRLLAIRNDRKIRQTEKSQQAIYLNLFIQLLLLAIIFTVVRKNMNERKRAYVEIHKINEDLEQRITERTELLRRSEENFRSTLDNMMEGCQILDFDWKYIYLNDTADIHNHRPKTGLLGKRYMDEWPGIEETEVFGLIKRCLEDRIPGKLVNEFIYPDGHMQCFDLRIQPVPEGVFILSVDITERMLAEKEIKRLNERISTATLSAAVGIWDWDIVHNVLVWDDVMYLLYDIKKEAISGAYDAWISGLHPEDRQFSDEQSKNALKGIKDFDTEFRVIWPDGSIHILKGKAEVFRNEQGDPIRMVGVNYDITQQKNAESALRNSEAQFRSLLENSADAIFITDQTGKYIYTNRESTSMLGYSQEELLSRHIWDITPTERRVEYIDLFQSLLSIGKLFTEVELIRKDGTFLFVDLNTVLLPNGTVYGSCRDITERKKTQKELIMHQNHLEEIVAERTEELRFTLDELNDLYENAPCGYHSLGSDGTILRVNSTELKWLQYERNELVGKVNVIDLFTPESRDRFKENFPVFLKKGEINNLELDFTRRDGTTFTVSLNGTAIFDNKGDFHSSRSTLFDITERKLAERALAVAKKEADEANKAKSEFLANMSHEIRTPMNAVLGYTELLKSIVSDPVQKTYVDSIRTSGKSLLTLINDILDLSKIEAGKFNLECDYIESYPFFSGFERVLALKANEKSIRFILDIESGLPAGIYIDEARLGQVVINLLSNAVKFTAEGSVTLKVRAIPSEIRNGDPNMDDVIDLSIEVIDTGIGISRKLHQSIFEPFVQGQEFKQYGGTGLGLAITKKLVTLMNGSIRLTSEAGIGTTISIALPETKCLNDFSKGESKVMIDPTLVVFEKSVVLIADDTPHNRTFIIDALKDTPLVFLEADDGSSAYEIAKKNVPDLIIADIRMPVWNGFQLLEKLKSDEELKHIPVIAYSASVLKNQKERITQSAFHSLMIKPVSIGELYAELLRILPHKVSEPDQALQTNHFPEQGEINDLPGLSYILENVVFNIWKGFEIRQPIGEIRDFGAILVRTAETHNAEIIYQYGKQIIHAVDGFDIDAMLKLLGKFPALIEELKNGQKSH
jgi:PAS domain S-box-containing protein